MQKQDNSVEIKKHLRHS